MDLAARACFEPCAAMAVFRKLGAAEKQFMDKAGVSGIPAYLRTHPPSEARTPARAAPAAACARRMVTSRVACAQERMQCLQEHLPEAQRLAALEGCELGRPGDAEGMGDETQHTSARGSAEAWRTHVRL